MALFLVAMAVVAAVAGCSSATEPAVEEVRHSPSPYANVDLANTRNASGSLDSSNVSDLELAWSRPLEGEGEGFGFTASPVVADGVIYVQDYASNIYAIDLSSGQTVWERRYDVNARGSTGLVLAEGMVFGTTPTGAFALDADSGKEVWSSELVRNETELIDMTPGYHRGLIYLSTAPLAEQGGEVGVLWALDAKSGKKVWHFDTVPKGLWGNPEINFGGGVYQPPAFDGEGSMYVGIANSGPIPGTEAFPWGSSRPGPNLYSNSVVKLDEKTGKVEWHYQVTPHGLCNWDMGGPILTEARGRKLVVAAGLSGIVVALDRQTGKPVWRRPVGIHNGHDNDGLLAMRGEYEKLKTPMTVYPGVFGGVAGSMSVRGSTVFVPVVNNPTRLNTQESAEVVGSATGELVALDLLTGTVKWKESFENPPYGPTLVTNDLVFTVTIEGYVRAFDIAKGEEVWSRKLPSEAEGGLTVTGDTLLVRAGFLGGEFEPKLVAYRPSG